LRALRRRGRRFRKAEAARISEKQFRIRIERAVTIVARTGSDVAPACRSVGLHNMEAHNVVRALCDERKNSAQILLGLSALEIAGADVGRCDAEQEGNYEA
jgi:hypothetical protein